MCLAPGTCLSAASGHLTMGIESVGCTFGVANNS